MKPWITINQMKYLDYNNNPSPTGTLDEKKAAYIRQVL